MSAPDQTNPDGEVVSKNPRGMVTQRMVKKALTEARRLVPAAIKVCGRIMEDEEAPASARLSAANTILDRALGKPNQSIETSSTVRLDVSQQYLDVMKELARSAQSARVTTPAGELIDVTPEGSQTVELNGKLISKPTSPESGEMNKVRLAERDRPAGKPMERGVTEPDRIYGKRPWSTEVKKDKEDGWTD